MQRDEVALEDIRNAARRAVSYVEGMNRAEFEADDKTKAAVVRELTIMGEAATRLSQSYRDTHTEVPWHLLVRLRNFYMHVYDAVNYRKVWATLGNSLPRIEEAVSALLDTVDEDTQ